MSCHRDPRMMSDFATRLVRLAKELEKAECKAKQEPNSLNTAALNEARKAEWLAWEDARRYGLDLNALNSEVCGRLG